MKHYLGFFRPYFLDRPRHNPFVETDSTPTFTFSSLATFLYGTRNTKSMNKTVEAGVSDAQNATRPLGREYGWKLRNLLAWTLPVRTPDAMGVNMCQKFWPTSFSFGMSSCRYPTDIYGVFHRHFLRGLSISMCFTSFYMHLLSHGREFTQDLKGARERKETASVTP